ncbi:hypothetical protein CsatB_028858 [Cannabis sativa]
MGKGSKIHWKAWNNLCTSKFFGGLRFRSLVHHNQAMIAKQAWRVLSNPNSTLAAIFKAKYFKHTGFYEARLGHSPSFTWSSLLWGRDLLSQGLMWKVGNGCFIRTLEDYWVPDSQFLQLIASDPPASFG